MVKNHEKLVHDVVELAVGKNKAMQDRLFFGFRDGIVFSSCFCSIFGCKAFYRKDGLSD